MIKFEDGKINGNLLDYDNLLSERTIKFYNYGDYKDSIEEIFDILAMAKIVHSMKKELNYEINDGLQFVTFIAEDKYKIKGNEIFTLRRDYYDSSSSEFIRLLLKLRNTYNKLNEVERFIIKSMEYDYPKVTDEELMEKLFVSKNKYFNYKKSAYIKLGLSLNIKELFFDTMIKQNLKEYKIREIQE